MATQRQKIAVAILQTKESQSLPADAEGHGIEQITLSALSHLIPVTA